MAKPLPWKRKVLNGRSFGSVFVVDHNASVSNQDVALLQAAVVGHDNHHPQLAAGHEGREGSFVAVEHAFRIQERVVVDKEHVGAARGISPVVARRNAFVEAKLDILPARERGEER